MPGLVNCHGHSPMTLVRSAGDGLPLERWLRESVWPREARLEDEDVYWGMVLGAAELLGNGVTTTCEQYRHPTAVVDAVLDAGIRTVYTPAIFDVPDAGPGKQLGGAAGRRLRAGRRRRRGRTSGSRWASGRTPPTRCRREGLRAIAAEARARDALLQIHLSETAAECEVVQERYGMSAPALLASEGVLEGRVLAAHAVWLDDADLARARRARRGRGPLPGLEREAGLGHRPLAGAARPRRAGGTGHRRAGLQRRPPPVGRAAAGPAPRPGHRRRPRRPELGRGAPPGHPRRRGGARPRRGRARGGAAGGPHPAAHRRRPLHARR